MFCRLNFFILFIAVTFISKGQGFLKANGKTIVDGNGKEILLRGIGLGGWMLQEPYMLQLPSVARTQTEIKSRIIELVGEERTAAFYDAWLTNHCTKADIDSLVKWGFNSLRLPMHYNLFTLPIEEEVGGKNTWIEKGFALTDSLLTWCAANKIYLILDLHAAPGGQGHDAAISDYDTSKYSLWESVANREKMLELWKKLARRYVNEKWIGGYDLLNEPNWGFENPADKNGCAETKNETLRKLYADIATAIRTIDTNHIIIIEGNCWGNNYAGIFPFNYPNTVVSFHKYWNYNNLESLKGMLEVREKYNMPIWLGESGENSNTWTTQAIKLLEDNNIGWAWWPLKKLGFNCPFEVKKNKGYQDIINYWEGKDEKPSEQVAFNGLMELAENLKVKNTIYHKDFLDAMFRQVKTTAVIPFSRNIITNESRIFASDYDLGRNGYAWWDKDTANYWVSNNERVTYNKGRTYRNDGVDISTCADIITNGYSVGWTEPGEWMHYTVNVLAAGSYKMAIRYTSADSAGAVAISINRRPSSGTIHLQKTEKNIWRTADTNIRLNKGINRIKVTVASGGFNLNYFQFFKNR